MNRKYYLLLVLLPAILLAGGWQNQPAVEPPATNPPIHSQTTGTIEGKVLTAMNQPVVGAEVFIYGTDIRAITDSSGNYRLENVTPAFPRYIVCVEHPGYYGARQGRLDVRSGETTIVNFTLESINNETSYKTQILDVRLCYLIDNKQFALEPLQPAENAVLDISLYPDSIKPYLESGAFMDKAHPDIVALAQEILDSVPSAKRSNQTEVAKAVYVWVVKHIGYDLMHNYPGDVTCGNWQTVNCGWGKNFTDWCYLPHEVVREGRAICIEYERLAATLLRALNIPARPAPLKAHPVTQWWVQLPDGSGYWANMETSVGHSKYLETGDSLALFPSKPDHRIGFWWPNADAPIHNHWELQQPCLWREVTEGGSAVLEHTSSGLSTGQSLLDEFSQYGEIRFPGPPPEVEQPHYELYSRGFAFDLATIGEQKKILCWFPVFITNQYHEVLQYALWTSHPEWLKRTWVDTLFDERTRQSIPLFMMEFELQPVFPKEETLKNGDFEVGDSLPLFWTKLPGSSAQYLLSDEACRGDHSAYISQSLPQGVAAYCQTLPVSPGDHVRITGWIKTEMVTGDATIDVEFRGNFQSRAPFPKVFPRLNGTSDWRWVSGEFTAPAGTDSMVIHCLLLGTGRAWFDDLKMTVYGTEITEIKNERTKIPVHFNLEQNYPNPFNPTTTIRFALLKREHVTLRVFDVLGREVATLVNKELNPGEHSVVYDARRLSSGVYFYRLTTPTFSQTKAMEVVK
ncbi:MAG: carboxypeptidase regulatory-like domain-containing protein [Bacteroidales bacterium]